jgi:hypothetical protein
LLLTAAIGQNGAPGKDGEDGAPGKDGAPGPKGEDGKDGQSVAIMELSNDTDVIPADPQGVVQDEALAGATTTVTVLLGTEKQSLVDNDTSLIAITSNLSSTAFQQNTHYSYNQETGVFSILQYPTSWPDSVIIIFTYEKAPLKLQKAFTLSRHKSEAPVDYFLELSQTSINTTENGGSIEVCAKKQVGTTIEILKNAVINRNTYESGILNYDYNKGDSGDQTFVLTVDGVIWDTESVSLVKDGAKGADGGDLEVQYQNATSASALIEDNWEDSIPTVESDKKTFMRQKLST